MDDRILNLETAVARLLQSSACKNGCDPMDMSCDTNFARAALTFVRSVRDGCQLCHGVRGGTPGNENRMYGLVVCDYCSATLGKVEDKVRDETLAAASRIARLTKGGFSANIYYGDSPSEAELVRDAEDGPWVLNGEIANRIDSVRLKNNRWQSNEAMRLWGEATDITGRRLHEQFDGNGRERP